MLRAVMEERIQGLVDISTEDPVNGKVYIMYERLGDFQWILGRGDGETLRRVKHWRLIIQLGLDWITLEFLENSLVSRQGVVLVGPFDPTKLNEKGRQKGEKGEFKGKNNVKSLSGPAVYHIGNLTKLSSRKLFGWIQTQFNEWKEYNIFQKNCQHFVYDFITYFEGEGYLTDRTPHLQATESNVNYSRKTDGECQRGSPGTCWGIFKKRGQLMKGSRPPSKVALLNNNSPLTQ